MFELFRKHFISATNVTCGVQTAKHSWKHVSVTVFFVVGGVNYRLWVDMVQINPESFETRIQKWLFYWSDEKYCITS